MIKIKKTERPWEPVAALPGLMGNHQRFLLALQAERIAGLDAQIQQPDAQVIAAEVGADVAAFPTPGHLAAWAGVGPGKNRSGDKPKRSP